MPYLNETGLAYYDPKLKEWISTQPVKTLPSTLYPWTQTDKAGAVTCWPVGGTELKPTVDFLFTETPPASGDKGPDNPSTITGVSSVNVGRIGKNQLLRIESIPNWLGIVVTANADGTYTFNGSFTNSTYSARAFTDSSTSFSSTKSSVRLDPSKTYTLSAELVSGSVTLADPDGSKPSIVYGYSDAAGGSMLVYLPLTVGKNSQSNIAKVNSSGEFIARVQQFQSATFTNAVYRFQLEEGSTATDFEAPMLPADANHVLPLGSTYYGGTLDVASGVMTVTHAVFVYDGTNLTPSTSNFAEYGERYSLQYYFPSIKMAPPGIGDISIYATDILPLNTPDVDSLYIKSNSSGVDIRMLKSDLNLGDGLTRADVVPAYKAWFADHPLTFVYPRSSPLTVQLTPTQILSLAQADKYTPRLNTIYTDASAVQVGYVKSPMREEYELQQAIVSQGGNV